MAVATAQSEPASSPSSAESLGREISELCSYIYAAEAKLLDLIHRFDADECYASLGFHSTAHWLNYQCGVGMNAARERVRVANALAELPKLKAALGAGKLSYSKARALTRIADSKNEDYLLMIATYGTAHHVEKLVALYRRSVRLQDIANAQAVYAGRELTVRYDEQGAMIVHGRFPAEQGALIVKALEMAMDRDFADASGGESGERTSEGRAARPDAANDPDGAASPAAESPGNPPQRIATRRADALAAIAETYLNRPDNAGCTADRYQVVLHVAAPASDDDVDSPADLRAEVEKDPPAVTLADEKQDSVSLRCDSTPTNPPAVTPHIEHGMRMTHEASRRLACDCSVLPIKEDRFGEVLSIGRKSRSIPTAIRRALIARDGGCRFPGCTHTRFVDGHHIRHWADGGETSLSNLVLLCRHHHRLVHDGGFGCSKKSSGEVVFTDTRDRPIEDQVPLPGLSIDLDRWLDTQFFELSVDGDACRAKHTSGERMDWDLAVAALF